MLQFNLNKNIQVYFNFGFNRSLLIKVCMDIVNNHTFVVKV